MFIRKRERMWIFVIMSLNFLILEIFRVFKFLDDGKWIRVFLYDYK